jgi:hypothetical protein
MALSGSVMKSAFQSTIYAGLKRVFASEVAQASDYTSVAEAQWEKLADALSDIAVDIVTQIQTDAEVAPGIAVSTTGSASAQTGTTTAPGKIT